MKTIAAMLGLLASSLLVGCTPRIEVAAPKEPITIKPPLRNAPAPLAVTAPRVEEAVPWVESVAAPVPVIASTALPAPSVHSTTS